eukprot:jgi/Astpho2/8165/e_gw1.00120.97.1_t
MAISHLLQEAGSECDRRGDVRLPYKPEGWNFWRWQGHNIHYIQAGIGTTMLTITFCHAGESGSPILLVHGFGASAYHWRYNIPELAKRHRVFAVDLLGFGWSTKALVDYQYGIWSDQLAAFIQEVIGEPAAVAGNSLGGYSSLAVAALHPDLVKGVVLLNGAGRFEDPNASPSDAAGSQTSLIQAILSPIATLAKRVAVYGSFVLTKQPSRIKSVLNQVYSVDPSHVDDELVTSIVRAAQDPNAAEVFYRVITGGGSSINSLLAKLDGMPLLLCWGENDPWIRPASADRVQKLYPQAERVSINAGHCPHDEASNDTNAALLKWLDNLPSDGKQA